MAAPHMKKSLAAKLIDWAVTGAFIAFAGSCGLFAGYMIVRLNSMENPPANMGLNFPPPKKRVITDGAVEVDSMTTQSRTVPSAPAQSQRVLQPYSRHSPVLGLRLLAVVDGLAFVEVTRVTGQEILPVERGFDIPGAGRVEWIERIDGRWQIKAGDDIITSVSR